MLCLHLGCVNWKHKHDLNSVTVPWTHMPPWQVSHCRRHFTAHTRVSSPDGMACALPGAYSTETLPICRHNQRGPIQRLKACHSARQQRHSPGGPPQWTEAEHLHGTPQTVYYASVYTPARCSGTTLLCRQTLRNVFPASSLTVPKPAHRENLGRD